jgi:hypothetical protein
VVAGATVGPPATFEPGLDPDRLAPAAGRSGASRRGDETVTVAVAGRVGIVVEGRPYPGETVDIRASVDGVPMGRAAVEVDGERVARTDDEGRATVTVPEGIDSMRITVSRGDFTGSKTVEVLRLTATLRPDGFVLVPGGAASVVATVGSEPAPEAVVRVDGERVGTTRPDGELPVVLPADPTARITVSTDRQTTTVSLLGLYWLPLLLSSLLVAALTWGGYRRRGRTGAAAVVGVVAGLLAVLLVDAYLGRAAGHLAAATLGGAGVLAGLVRWRRSAANWARTASEPGRSGRLLSWARERLLVAVRRAVGRLEALLDRLAGVRRRLAAWLRSLPRSVPGLLRRFVRGVRALAGRAAAALRRPRVRATTLGVAAGAALGLAGGYALAGPRGVGAVAVGLAFAGAGWWYHRREPATADDGSGTAADRSPDPSPAVGAGKAGGRTLRQLWRAFASGVVPGGWRTRTPAEVSRAAIRKGYPEGPVRELTTAFRTVEYGHRSLTDAVCERAHGAYEALAAHRERDGPAGSAADPDPDSAERSGDAEDRETATPTDDHDGAGETP